jgi:hypothetical protein
MTYISEAIRRDVRNRAGGKCEYCLLNERYGMKPHEIDHIIAEKHGGETALENLCLSCLDCNRYKGSDLCSFDAMSGNIINLYHPRRDGWEEHFQISDAIVQPLTPIGRVTARLLRINDVERVDERTKLLRIGRYP